MKIFLVQAAGDVTGRSGYGRAILDKGHPFVLVSFADQTYNRRNTILPDPDDPVWDLRYCPETKTLVTPRGQGRTGGYKGEGRKSRQIADLPPFPQASGVKVWAGIGADLWSTAASLQAGHREVLVSYFTACSPGFLERVTSEGLLSPRDATDREGQVGRRDRRAPTGPGQLRRNVMG